MTLHEIYIHSCGQSLMYVVCGYVSLELPCWMLQTSLQFFVSSEAARIDS